MSPAAQQERIQAMCKTLKLDRVAIDYDGLAQTASERQTPYSDFLEQVLGAEIAMRTERTREVLAAESSPRTADLLESRGLKVKRLGISELQKAEAGVTCLSVIF